MENEPILFITLLLEKAGLPVAQGFDPRHGLEYLTAPYMTYTWLVMAFLFFTAKLTMSNIELIPGHGQNFWEIVVGGFESFCAENMGKELTNTFFPLIMTFGLFIAVSNLVGLVPGFMSPTASLNTTLALALIVWVLHHYIGIREHGWKYYKHFIGPIPALIPLMLPIELISNFARIISLSVRLFGNIMAKEMMLIILFTLAGCYFAPLPFMVLGVLVSLVQAMVFVLLTVVYFSQAKEHAH
ncbi:MAG: F0F1 ATP synthase subunit A [Desulfobulbaceae bacterium]|jgi:F-type H+-transporting ATPase subunit a|nr:F0F1 ATP synthase subunit A [Desulfobulbaceae bacterium]